MKTTQIKELKQQGLSDDSIYERAAGLYGVYGVAFFGHKLKDKHQQRRAKRLLNTVWKRILNTQI